MYPLPKLTGRSLNVVTCAANDKLANSTTIIHPTRSEIYFMGGSLHLRIAGWRKRPACSWHDAMLVPTRMMCSAQEFLVLTSESARGLSEVTLECPISRR